MNFKGDFFMRHRVLTLTLCMTMNILFYFDCWGHQELKIIALKGL